MSNRNRYVQARPAPRPFRRLAFLALIAAPYAVLALDAGAAELVWRQADAVLAPAPEKPAPVHVARAGLKIEITDDWAMPGAELAQIPAPEARS